MQPLVENALDHGLFPKVSDCRLLISAHLNDGEVRLCVEDNGVGIPTEKLTGLLVESERIGLKNVSQRLVSLYGEKYGLSLTSRLNEGTRAVIRIPYESWVSA